MLVLRVPDPTLDDKVQILQRHILPEAAEDHGLGDTVVLPKEGAAHLVRKVSQHDAGAKGLRQVKRSLHGILSRVLLLRLSAASSLSMGPVLDDLKMDFHRRSMLLDVDWTAPQTVLDGRIIDALYTSGDADFSASLAMYS
jgi:ATP-dependent Lon protease